MMKENKLSQAFKAYWEADFSKAYEMLDGINAKESRAACLYLGEMYEFGRGVKSDSDKAISCYLEAKIEGCPIADYNLGQLFLGEYDTPSKARSHLESAYKGLKKGAERGHASSAFAVFSAINDEILFSERQDEAVYWLTLAADLEHSKARHYLAEILWEGNNIVDRDRSRAINLWKSAAQSGFIESQYILGFEYATSNETIDRRGEAIKWYEMASSAGHVEAGFNMGAMLMLGEHVEQNIARGFSLIERAAGSKCVNAIQFLADTFEMGFGDIEPDLNLAQYWRDQYKEIAAQEETIPLEGVGILSIALSSYDAEELL